MRRAQYLAEVLTHGDSFCFPSALRLSLGVYQGSRWENSQFAGENSGLVSPCPQLCHLESYCLAFHNDQRSQDQSSTEPRYRGRMRAPALTGLEWLRDAMATLGSESRVGLPDPSLCLYCPDGCFPLGGCLLNEQTILWYLQTREA
jgi:hypothetical protein